VAGVEKRLARVRPAWLEIVDAVETVNRFRSRSAGAVRINTSEELLLRVLPIVLEFMTAYPEVKVDLIVEGRFVDIVAEGFDAGLRHAESVPQDMVAMNADQNAGNSGESRTRGKFIHPFSARYGQSVR
jgi:DNA-binding transcriptional LysR family regulator